MQQILATSTQKTSQQQFKASRWWFENDHLIIYSESENPDSKAAEEFLITFAQLP